MQRSTGHKTRNAEKLGLDNGDDTVNDVKVTSETRKGVNSPHYVDAENGHIKLDLDVLVVGAGFAGCYFLYRLRKEGFSVKIVEAGSDVGGIWHWNIYPGARVDGQCPIYAFSIPEVYKTWSWTEEYPGSDELRQYFAHVDEQLDLKKDILLNNKVLAAEFDTSEDKWTIRCDDETTIRASFFITAIGFAAKRHFSDWKGLDTFEGVIHHSSFWPSQGVDVKGIQIAQETAREAGELTLFQRTPNLCCPMRQAPLTVEQQEVDKAKYPEMFKVRLSHYAGFMYSRRPFNTISHTPEERETFFEELWQMGGFRMLANNYSDMMTDKVANMETYRFWLKKVRARITDPEKRDILAPIEPPHPFGGKRLSLEQDFYEQMDKPHVHIVDIKKNPVTEAVPEGIITVDGRLHEFEIIALATGFDFITGGLKDIDIRGIHGETLSQKWEKGTWTYLGLSTSGFPNFFFLYGPQGPTAFSNGPSCVEPQGDWVVDVLKGMRVKEPTRIDAVREAELEWKQQVNALHAKSLRNTVDSWYMGASIPGKPREPLNYAGGVPSYIKTINDVLKNGYEGFKVA